MIEKKPPHAEGTHTSQTAHDVDASGTEAHGTHTTVRSEQIQAPTPKIEGSHTQETVDPAERLPNEPEEQNDLA